MDEHVGRLAGLAAELEGSGDDDLEAAEAADRASFDPGPAAERSRRHQASLGRELLRTIEALRRLRTMGAPPAATTGRLRREGGGHACEARRTKPIWNPHKSFLKKRLYQMMRIRATTNEANPPTNGTTKRSGTGESWGRRRRGKGTTKHTKFTNKRIGDGEEKKGKRTTNLTNSTNRRG